MRKVLMVLALATAVLSSAAGGASADNGADWLTAGTATLAPPPQFGQPMLHVNAQSGYGGVNARGHFWIRYPNGGGEFGGHVVCLNVLINEARLYGRVEIVKTPRTGFRLGDYVPIRLIDSGSPGTFDAANFDVGTTSSPDSGCTQNASYVPISQGNYTVHDQPVTDLLGLDQLLAQFESAANDPYG